MRRLNRIKELLPSLPLDLYGACSEPAELWGGILPQPLGQNTCAPNIKQLPFQPELKKFS